MSEWDDDIIKKYVCKNGELNNSLPDELAAKIRGLFYSDYKESAPKTPLPRAWRMFHGGISPKRYFNHLGIDLKHLTMRDAVALDLVKLEDDSVSNDYEYTFKDKQTYSREDFDRCLLHRNFRINLVRLEPENANITYGSDGKTKTKKTMDAVYLGLVLSDTILGYFASLFNSAWD